MSGKRRRLSRKIRTRLRLAAWVLIPLAIICGAAYAYFAWIYMPAKITPAKIGVITIDDPIYTFDYARQAENALEDPSIKAVVVRVNSPGGSVNACFQTETAFSRLAENKPVVANFEGCAASGAYLVASASDYIYAYDQSVTGSLAVIAVWVSYERYYEKEGIDVYVWKSGEQKDLFQPWRSPTEEDNAEIQELIDNITEELFDRITANRPETENYIDNLRDGSVIYGWEALDYHLVDAIGSHQDAIRKAADMAGLEEGEYEVVNLSE